MSEDIGAWFSARIPAGWFVGPPEVSADSEEILVLGTLPEVELASGTSSEARAAARVARIDRFREDTRDQRMRIADEAERQFRRKVSWGAECAGERVLFTTLSVPVMTRLRLDERAVLDTLVRGGVARSRSHALAWCVRLVGTHQGDWIKDLQDALVKVQQVRDEGPE